MDNLSSLGTILGGIGLFMLGYAALKFVSIYRESIEKKEK